MQNLTPELVEALDTEQVENLFNCIHELNIHFRGLTEDFSCYIKSSHEANQKMKEVSPPEPSKSTYLCGEMRLPCFYYDRASELSAFIKRVRVMLTQQNYQAVFTECRSLMLERLGFGFFCSDYDLFVRFTEFHNMAQQLATYLQNISDTQPVRAGASLLRTLRTDSTIG